MIAERNRTGSDDDQPGFGEPEPRTNPPDISINTQVQGEVLDESPSGQAHADLTTPEVPGTFPVEEATTAVEAKREQSDGKAQQTERETEGGDNIVGSGWREEGNTRSGRVRGPIHWQHTRGRRKEGGWSAPIECGRDYEATGEARRR